MSKKLNKQEFEKLVKSLILKEFNSKEFEGSAMKVAKKDIENDGQKFSKLGQNNFEKSPRFKEKFKDVLNLEEYFNDEDNNPDENMFSGDFNGQDFNGDAMRAAMEDIGGEFETLGKSKSETNLNVDEFISDLQRQNLNLRKDIEDLKKIKNTMDIKNTHEKQFGIGSLNEDEHTTSFDSTNLYKFLKDALYYCESQFLDYAESAQVLETALNLHFSIQKKISEELSISDNKLNEVKDSKGNKIRLKTKVTHKTGAEGEVIGFANGDKGLAVRVNWFGKEGSSAMNIDLPNDVVYVDSIEVRDPNKTISEEEIGESMSRSYTNAKGKNLKPHTFPTELMGDSLNENLDKAQISTDEENFLVIDNEFNRIHYKDLIGKTFKDAPGYAQVKVVKNSETEKQNGYKTETTNEEIDFYKQEIDYYDAQTRDGLESEMKKIVPEELQQFVLPHSFVADELYSSFELYIPKQSDETLREIEKFVKGELSEYTNVELYTELEKKTDKWIIKVKFINYTN